MGASDPTLVVGGGVAGLAAAIDLAATDRRVTLLEMGASVGGKLRPNHVDGRPIDAGPTVFTMKWVFDELFERAGAQFDDAVSLTPAAILARHAWDPGAPGGAADWFDLPADPEKAAAAVGDFAGACEADRFRAFRENAAEIFAPLKDAMLIAQRGGPLAVAARLGLAGSIAMARRAPPQTLWRAIGRHLRDPRLRQLFARYATYCGSSPFLAPSALMLVAHVEQAGVWSLDGGMAALGRALEARARALGVEIRTQAPVDRISIARGRATGVGLANGEALSGDAIVFAGDGRQLEQLLARAEGGPAAKAVERSLSAVVTTAVAKVAGAPLHHHTVFFSNAYQREFDEIFSQRKAPTEPTTYVCAQDRDIVADEGPIAAVGPVAEAERPATPERLQILANAPADGAASTVDTHATERRALDLIARCGVDIEIKAAVRRGPAEFAELYPGSDGALYGPATHGFMGAFNRPGARTRVKGLYLASGSAHPGPGVPMAALSGRLAAEALCADAEADARARRAQLSSRRSPADGSRSAPSLGGAARTERS